MASGVDGTAPPARILSAGRARPFCGGERRERDRHRHRDRGGGIGERHRDRGRDRDRGAAPGAAAAPDGGAAAPQARPEALGPALPLAPGGLSGPGGLSPVPARSAPSPGLPEARPRCLGPSGESRPRRSRRSAGPAPRRAGRAQAVRISPLFPLVSPLLTWHGHRQHRRISPRSSPPALPRARCPTFNNGEGKKANFTAPP